MSFYTDAFGAADGTSPPNGNWTNGDAGCQANGGGAASNADGTYGYCKYTGNTFAGNDLYSQVVMGGSRTGGPCVRMSGSDTTYLYDVDDSGASVSRLYSRVAGGYTDISPSGLTTYSGGETAKVQVVGTTLKVFKNGVQEGTDVTDSSISSGVPGFMCRTKSGSLLTIDDWEGGDVSSGVLLTPGAGSIGLTGQALALSIFAPIPARLIFRNRDYV